ncbi:hypothetical protein U1Q18_020077 [Sarracenia purpurea var. burkii]
MLINGMLPSSCCGFQLKIAVMDLWILLSFGLQLKLGPCNEIGILVEYASQQTVGQQLKAESKYCLPSNYKLHLNIGLLGETAG